MHSIPPRPPHRPSLTEKGHSPTSSTTPVTVNRTRSALSVEEEQVNSAAVGIVAVVNECDEAFLKVSGRVLNNVSRISPEERQLFLGARAKVADILTSAPEPLRSAIAIGVKDHLRKTSDSRPKGLEINHGLILASLAKDYGLINFYSTLPGECLLPQLSATTATEATAAYLKNVLAECHAATCRRISHKDNLPEVMTPAQRKTILEARKTIQDVLDSEKTASSRRQILAELQTYSEESPDIAITLHHALVLHEWVKGIKWVPKNFFEKGPGKSHLEQLSIPGSASSSGSSSGSSSSSSSGSSSSSSSSSTTAGTKSSWSLRWPFNFSSK